jgi:hypothetical protein
VALCPHCQHALPDDATGLCPHCGGELPAVAPAAEEPAPGAPPPAEAGGAGEETTSGTAWDRRGQIGLLGALAETTRDVLASPSAFFRAMPRSGGPGGPLLYAVIIGWIGLVAASFYQALFSSIVGSRLERFGERPELASVLAWMEGWHSFAWQVVLGGVLVVIGVFLAAGLLHVMLLLLGAARGGFEATFRVICFSHAFSVFALVPFCGSLLVLPYVIVLWVLGLSAVHGTGEGRSYAAIVLACLLVCCCLVGLFVVLGGLAGLAAVGGLGNV